MRLSFVMSESRDILDRVRLRARGRVPPGDPRGDPGAGRARARDPARRPATRASATADWRLSRETRERARDSSLGARLTGLSLSVEYQSIYLSTKKKWVYMHPTLPFPNTSPHATWTSERTRNTATSALIKVYRPETG